MDDLITFVRARLDEDERYLYSNRHHLWTKRPMREVTAKRTLIAFALRNAASIDGEWGDCHSADEIAAGKCADDGRDAALDVLAPLAAIWSDHPDYRAEWAPESVTAGSLSG